jgi:hypothetical protein
MARETHHVTVTAHQTTQYTKYAQLLAAVKNLAVSTSVDSSLNRDHFVVADRSITISGFWPAVEFILERYPGDNIQSGWSLEHRAVQRSLTHDLLAMNKVCGVFEQPLKRWYEKSPTGFLIEAEIPSLVDLAYLAVGDATSAPIKALRGVFNQYVQESKAAYAA